MFVAKVYAVKGSENFSVYQRAPCPWSPRLTNRCVSLLKKQCADFSFLQKTVESLALAPQRVLAY